MKQLTILLVLPILSACSLGVYGGDFDCDPSNGLGCKSVSDVNESITKERKPHSCSPRRIYFPSHEDQGGNNYGESYVILNGGEEAE